MGSDLESLGVLPQPRREIFLYIFVYTALPLGRFAVKTFATNRPQ